ncbi:MAG: xanthine dehydrogenase small subunit [Pseudomonadota bacterium]
MRRQVRFVHDGALVTLNDVDPTRTVLQYLREDINQTGTKEGCAEGDCGACMVVIAEPDDNDDSRQLRYRAVNACIQFVATLDGKELITVESLSQRHEPLHPAQQAMVDTHASQCGFCTPGFVMSLFALYKHGHKPARNDIDDALSGNLCRCTGYRPIVDAATQMLATPAKSTVRHWQPDSGTHDAATLEQLRALDDGSALHTRADERHFVAPRTVAELAREYTAHPDATLLAGGTDVGLWVTKQYRELERVIYVGNVAELNIITRTATSLDIGAAVTFSDLAPTLLSLYPTLTDLIRRWASTPVRNAATLGGNIANGSPIGDSMPALIALGTTLTLQCGENTRTLALEALYHDYQVNDLQPGEFVAHIHVPLPTDGLHVRSYKLSKRFDQDISAVCAGFAIQLDTNSHVRECRLAFGGVAGIPIRATRCESLLQGQPFDEAHVRRAMQCLRDEFTPLTDMRASADYRRTSAANLLYRLFIEITQPEVATDVYNFAR